MNAEFAAKLVAAMSAMSNPRKDKTATVPTKSGGKYTYKYTQLDDVESIIRPALLENGLLLLQGVEEATDHYNLVCAVSDGECTLTLDRRRFAPSGDPQAQGSYETYMRRYQLMTAFGLAGEDDDGAAASPQTQARMAQKQPQKPPFAELTDRFYAGCGRIGADPDDTWSQMVTDIGMLPDPSMSASQLRPAFDWVSRMQ